MKKRTLLLILTWTLLSGAAPHNSIRVKFGEPNVWSLDQAHYLLEQRFQKNNGLEATRPTAEDLNANAANGSRLSAVRTLIQAGAGLDQSVGLTNQLAQRRIFEDLGSRQTRQAQLDQSFTIQAQLAAQIDDIAKDPANYVMKTDGTKGDMLSEPKARTAALGLQLEAEKRRGDHLKSLLSDTVPTQLAKTESPTAPNLGQLSFDMLKDKFALGDARLAASNSVDNFVNLQNEMIMKQVTLLRNEAGFNRRIVFAEIPQHIEVEGLRWYRKASENKLVQVQWRMRGFLYEKRRGQEEIKKDYIKDATAYKTRLQATATQTKLAHRSEIQDQGELALQDAQQDAGLSEDGDGPYARRDVIVKTIEKMCDPSTRLRAYLKSNGSSPTKDASTLNAAAYGVMEDNKSCSADLLPPGTLRTIELVPRQSSLNLLDRHYAHNAVNLYGLFRLLSGFGLNIGYQRQKETYEQYLNQEVYASSFGKGMSEFGWTFAANPGTRTVAPGPRTTYAIFSVPTNALSVFMEARYCVYDRRDMLKDADCQGDWQEFIIPIPSEKDSGFWVNEVRYSPAPTGSRQVVYMSGTHFSNLTGVLVNGVPLRRSVAIAAPEMSVPAAIQNGDSGIVGEYEILGSRQLVLAFKMPLGHVGTPNIALITPTKARYLNDLKLNEVRVGAKRYYGLRARLNHPDVFPMFYARAEVKAVRREQSRLHVEGSGLSLNDRTAMVPWVRYYWNDEEVGVVRPLGVPVSTDGFANRVILDIASVTTAPGQRSDLRMEFDPDLGVEPLRHVTVDTAVFSISGAQVVSFIPGVPASVTKHTAHVPASALLSFTGTNLGSSKAVRLDYNDGSWQAVMAWRTTEGGLIARINPPDKGGFALFTVLNAAGQMPTQLSGSVEIPAPVKPKESEFEEAERTIKQVPRKKGSTK